MLDQIIATRVVEALAAAAVTHAASTQEDTNLGSNSSQNKACNTKIMCIMHKNSWKKTLVTREWNGNHPTTPNTTIISTRNKRPETAKCLTAGTVPMLEGHKAKDCQLPHLLCKPQWTRAKEDREVMLLVLDVAKRTLQEQVPEQWKSRRWKSNSRQPTKSSEQSKAYQGNP
ncbi:hypothetical protein Tco_0769083 [Tanacetum coccineum]|uniref:Uncharacterized protein n=1 Tax=Tanacetum coccineum TaxID=301880 RepID=A0ABQ4Z9A9_9ASTR